jgi:hypothetical protein
MPDPEHSQDEPYYQLIEMRAMGERDEGEE